jgi:pimeloyl-ACP methyl ester carboxylesterase
MQTLERPDGVQIAWDSAGEGPLVVMANQFFSHRDVFGALIDEIARDHRIVWYDARGTGSSTRRGPFDMETDVADLAALIEHLGEQAILLGLADGCNRGVHLAASRPDLISSVVSPAGNPVGRRAAQGTDALVASQTVLDALLGMMRTDYRGALNTMFSTSNPGLHEEDVRERVTAAVEHCGQDVAVARMNLWVYDDSFEDARAIGDRLWILEHGTNPWFTIEIAQRSREFLPHANVLEVENGPVTRPDICAGVVRRLSTRPLAGSAGRPRQD